MNPSGRIRIGQIGIGHNHAHEKMCALRKLSEVFDVVGVVEEDPLWRDKRGGLPGYQGLPWLTVERLLKIEGLDAVSVEPDVISLNSVAMRCLQAGKHIHMDKPAGESLREFREVLREADRTGIIVQMGYMFRNNPAIQFCCQAVREGWLGRIFSLDAVMSRMDGQEYRDWLSQFPGGALYIFGGHLIDLVLTMMGEPLSVTPYLRRTRPEVDSLHDNGMAVLEYPYATAVIRTAVIEVEGFLRRQLTVCGDEGTIVIHPIEPFNQLQACVPKLHMTLTRQHGPYKAGPQEVTFPAMTDRYDAQLQEFADMIRGLKPNRFPTDYELLLQKTLLAACGYQADLMS